MNLRTDDSAEKVPEIQETEAAPAPRTRERRLEPAGEVRILIIDDDVAVCEIIKRFLADKPFSVDVVSDPAQIEGRLAAATRKDNPEDPYHLIILDFVIPGVTSESVFDWIQKYQKHAGIIVVTGYPSIDSALSCLRARTYDYLTKPFDVNQLADVVMRCLEFKGLMRLSEDALCEALGGVIRERRKALDLTLSDLAKRANVSLGYLSQIELGKNSASIETLYRISLGLGLKLADLFLAVQERL